MLTKEKVSATMSPPLSPDAKRRRLTRENKPIQLLMALPPEMLLEIPSFLGAEDVLSLSRVSESLSQTLGSSTVLWKQVALTVDSTMEEVFNSLSNERKSVDAAALWRRCALSRTRARKQPFEQEPEKDPPEYYPPHHDFWNLPLPTEQYRSRSLGEYSFLLDIQNVDGSRKSCTIFLENIEADSNIWIKGFDKWLSLEIPEKYHKDYFPWVEDLEGEDPDDNRARWVYLGTMFTVYAIDRSSGRQAKIYNSGTDGADLWDAYQFRNPLKPQNYGTANPVRFFEASIFDPWMERRYTDIFDDRNLSFDLWLRFRDEENHSYSTTGEDVLSFLEKGHVYV